MEAVETAETQLQADIDVLRTQFANTQDLYREVCTLMFFRYGITPTANRLYQLVRKGSMSAPAEALNRFWRELREKSRVVIGQPDLPESVRNHAGELVGALWQAAQAEAARSLESFRDDAAAAIEESRLAQETASGKLAGVVDELAAASQMLQDANADLAAVRQQLAEAEALNGNLAARLDAARKELNEQHAWFRTVERDHAAALEKLREQLKADRAAADAARKHALQELDRERTAHGKVQKALDVERARAAAAAERHRGELRSALNEVADVRQQLGALESRAGGAIVERDHARELLDGVRRELALALAQAAASDGRAGALEAELRHAVARYEALLEPSGEMPEEVSPPRKGRRTAGS